jgi:hypothetical protein
MMSCAKKEGADTPSTRLQGRWTLTKTATDDNGSGEIDGYEIHAVSASQKTQKTFNKDASGVETNIFDGITSPQLNFTWKVLGSDSVRVSFSANDTITYYIATLSSANLTLITNTSRGLVAYYYDKK